MEGHCHVLGGVSERSSLCTFVQGPARLRLFILRYVWKVSMQRGYLGCGVRDQAGEDTFMGE